MTSYKMIALDMDGTLLNSDSLISDTNLQALQDTIDAGIWVCLSTGRGIHSITPFLDDLEGEVPIVAANGSEVWQNQHRLHSRVTMDPEQIEWLHELALRHDVWFWATTSEQVFNKDLWPEEPHREQWLKFGCYTEDEALLSELRHIFEEKDCFEITNSHPQNIELNPKGVNKASGLEQLCDIFELSMKDIVAMGDSLNDIAMIRAAGLGVAMGNAQDEVKRAADLTTLDNDQDGVAQIIRTVVLNQS